MDEKEQEITLEAFADLWILKISGKYVMALTPETLGSIYTMLGEAIDADYLAGIVREDGESIH